MLSIEPLLRRASSASGAQGWRSHPWCCPPVATEDTCKHWRLQQAGEPAHLVHTSRPDVSSMHPGSRHSLVEL